MTVDARDMLAGTSVAIPEGELLRVMGDDFLAYVCATEPTVITTFHDGGALDERRRVVFERTVELARQFSLWRRPNASNDGHIPPPGQEWEPLVLSFGQFCARTGEDETVAQQLRRAAGGEVTELPPEEDDPVRYALLWLARDLWPFVLLKGREDELFGFSLSGAGAAAFNHPAQTRLRAAVKLEREPLRRLFPNIDGEIPDSVRVASSIGTTGSTQLPLLGDQLIARAARRAGWPERREESRFLEEIDRQLEELRHLVRSRRVEVPVTVGLSGVRLPTGEDELPTALGSLVRSAEPTTDLSGQATTTVELTATFPLQYTLSTNDDMPQGPPPGFWEAWRELDNRIDRLRLAVLLAGGWGTGPAPRISSVAVHDPLFFHQSSRIQVGPPITLELEAAMVPEIQSWAQRISDHHRPEIALAIRRTLSAADNMREPEDGLVDAVIALESLFGTGQGEVGFRLQTSLAFLLGGSADERRAIHAEIGELYGVRSKLVHGAHFDDRAGILELRRRALEIVLDCLRLLFSTHHQLIRDGARGKSVILAGGAPPD